MKRLVIFFLFFFVTVNLFSQIVNNGNFETHSSCPTTYGFINLATGWNRPTTEGKAVYYARAMLISRFGYIDFDDDALCSSNGGDSHFRRANQNTSKEQNEIDIVPNPVLNSFVIKNNTDKELRSIDIFDMEGRHICTSKSVNIDMSKYSSGRYLARVKYTDNSETSKLFMKEE